MFLLKRKILKLKIKYKIILAMYIVMTPILLIISTYMYLKDYRSTINDMTSYYDNLTATVQENIDYLQADLLDLSTYLTINDDIRYILNTKVKDFDVKKTLIWEKSSPTDFVRDMISIKSYINTLILYTENGIQPFYLSMDNSVLNRDINEVHTMDIYENALMANGDHVWSRINRNDQGIYLNNKSDKIIISRVIFDWAKQKKIGFLVMGIDAVKYETICENAIQKENEGIIIFNRNGQELVHVGNVEAEVLSYIQNENVRNSLIHSSSQHFEYNENFIFYSLSETNSNIVFYILPKENWLSSINNTKLLPIAFGLGLLIALWPLSMFASTIISKPLRRLYQSMIKFKAGDFNQQVEVVEYDEIGEVTNSFNQMVKEIKELIDTNYVMVIKERQSELDALQAQINPHFLYNTLDSLYWQALNTNNEKLAEDIYSLSQLFRLVLSQGQGMIPIRRETELITHYLQIQKMRFEKKLNYNIDMDERIMFVENAIVHGLECTDEIGKIEVIGYMDKDTIVFKVMDNGVGMTKEQLNQVLEEKDIKDYSSQRIGRYAIKNVKERLSLKYREEFKLVIESVVGVGTTVTIVIPAKNE
jgi:two-component system sensor histidine kinase YesM